MCEVHTQICGSSNHFLSKIEGGEGEGRLTGDFSELKQEELHECCVCAREREREREITVNSNHKTND